MKSACRQPSLAAGLAVGLAVGLAAIAIGCAYAAPQPTAIAPMEAVMNLRNACTTLLACLAATAVALASVDRMCTWLVDDAGSTTRTAILLANAPLFGAGAVVAPVAAGAPHGRSRTRGAKATTRDETTGR